MAVRPEWIGHQRLVELEAVIDDQMGIGYIRLDWMDPDRQPFEVKAYVLEQLAKAHEEMCVRDIHAPGPPEDVNQCPYCEYRSASI